MFVGTTGLGVLRSSSNFPRGSAAPSLLQRKNTTMFSVMCGTQRNRAISAGSVLTVLIIAAIVIAVTITRPVTKSVVAQPLSGLATFNWTDQTTNTRWHHVFWGNPGTGIISDASWNSNSDGLWSIGSVMDSDMPAASAPKENTPVAGVAIVDFSVSILTCQAIYGRHC